MNIDIQERTFKFGLRIIKLGNSLPNTRAGNVIGKQLIRSGTSVGANIEEADAAYSKDDFIYKMNISLKEARETHYWLRIIEGANMLKPARLNSIIQEADEIKKILGAIVSKARGKSRK